MQTEAIAPSINKIKTVSRSYFSNNARLQKIIDALPHGIVILNDKGIVVERNPAAEKILETPLLGHTWLSLIQNVFSPKDDDGHEISLKNGKCVHLATQSLIPEPGQLIVISDLTQTRHLQELVGRQKNLEQMGEMTAHLAHQIRTPLSTAVIYANHLCHQVINEKMRHEYAAKILMNLNLLEQQIKNMLLFAKGEIVLAYPVILSHLLSDLNDSLHAVLTQNQAELIINSEISLDLEINVNRESLIGALHNLINNAIQASTHHRNINLIIHEIIDESSQTFLDFIVEDQGSGMTEELQKKISQPFFTTRSGGTGLGLAVVRAVAKSHGGAVWIQSEIDKGTRVTLRIRR